METSGRKEKLLAEINRLADERGAKPTMRVMDSEGKFSSSTYYTVFGSWNAAVEEAGFAPNPSTGGTVQISDAELLAELERLADDLDRTPRLEDMTDDGAYAWCTYKERFGSWNDALREAGLEPNVRRNIPTDELLSHIQSLSGQLDRVPSLDDMTDQGRFAWCTYKERFGSWNAALEAAGLQPQKRRDIPSDRLLAEIQTVTTDLGHAPTREEFDENSEFAPSTYQNRFGSWANAVREAGYSPREVPTGPDSPHWNGGKEGYYGPGWRTIRDEILERDDYLCRRCGMSGETHQDRYGHGLHVHHIIPFAEFDTSDEANRRDNLLTMCLDCHRKWEGIPLKPEQAPA